MNAVTVALHHAEVVAHRVGAPLRALALAAGIAASIPCDRLTAKEHGRYGDDQA